MICRSRGALVAALLLGCGDAPTDAPEDTDVVDTGVPLPSFETGLDPCSTQTWETVGAGFVLTWCAPCHSSDLRGSARQGAPVGVDFDDEAASLALADRILVRATGESPDMPPSGGPERAVLDDVVTWLQCAEGAAP